MTQTLGEEFARAVAAKDHDRIAELLHSDLDFRAMTPKRFWEASDVDGVIDALNVWFGETDHIEGIDALAARHLADRERVDRLQVRNDEGDHLVGAAGLPDRP